MICVNSYIQGQPVSPVRQSEPRYETYQTMQRRLLKRALRRMCWHLISLVAVALAAFAVGRWTAPPKQLTAPQDEETESAEYENWLGDDGAQAIAAPAEEATDDVYTEHLAFEHGGKRYSKTPEWFLGGADAQARAARVGHLRAICKRLAGDNNSGFILMEVAS